MDWTFIKNELPELGPEIIQPGYGKYRHSLNYLVATKNGGIYIGYYGADKLVSHTKWEYDWYTAYCIDDSCIDLDGEIINNVIAWCELPKHPMEHIKQEDL